MFESSIIKDKLLGLLAREVSLFGFIRHGKSHSFYKTTPFGKQAIHINISSDKRTLSVSVNMAVRFNKLEDVVNQVHGHLTNIEKRNTFSIGVELGNYEDGRPQYQQMHSDADVSSCVSEIVDGIVTVALPFFERFSTLQSVFSVLSGETKESQRLCPFDHQRAERVCASAYLLGLNTEFHKLSLSMAEMLERNRDRQKQDFLNLICILKKMDNV
jgi:hypothetical protein